MKAVLQTNHGSAIDWRAAGPKKPVAPCPIPDWVREQARGVHHLFHADLTQRGAILRALHVASLERAMFGMSAEKDAEVKAAVRLYISTWLIPPLLRALECLDEAATQEVKS